MFGFFFAEASGFVLLYLCNRQALTRYRNQSLAPADADIATSKTEVSFWPVLCQSQKDTLCACSLLFRIEKSDLECAS